MYNLSYLIKTIESLYPDAVFSVNQDLEFILWENETDYNLEDIKLEYENIEATAKNQATYKEIYEKAQTDLERADIEIKYHQEQSTRAKATLEDWYAYKESLRDIATIKDGVYSVNDISTKIYTYTIDDVKTDYTPSLDDDGYPIAPSTES